MFYANQLVFWLTISRLITNKNKTLLGSYNTYFKKKFKTKPKYYLMRQCITSCL